MYKTGYLCSMNYSKTVSKPSLYTFQATVKSGHWPLFAANRIPIKARQMKTVMNKNGSPASFLVDYSVDWTFNCSDALSTWGGRLYHSTQSWGLIWGQSQELGNLPNFLNKSLTYGNRTIGLVRIHDIWCVFDQRYCNKPKYSPLVCVK